jgi:hypothetical protein
MFKPLSRRPEIAPDSVRTCRSDREAGQLDHHQYQRRVSPLLAHTVCFALIAQYGLLKGRKFQMG